ncbi:MAG: ribonuclease D [Planctomycetes bacterium]|nr:ribonuclease D [Planctomycetota bacterium]
MTLIDRQDDLDRVLAALAPATTIALDTEFLWERTYHPTLALVQVAARDDRGEVQAFAVDPLRVDLGPLERLLGEPGRLKVVHAGRIDLELFQARLGAPLGPVFDTQRAAALVGHGHQVGYANLVEALVGRRLKKTEQWSDWTRRPLRPEQVSYALDDVVPLLVVRDRLEERLREAGRLAWAEEEMAPLTDPATYVRVPDEELWRRVKTRRGLDRRALGVLRALTVWREETSRARDLRPGFVVKDPVLVELARRAPTSRAQLEHVRGLHPGELKKSADGLLAAIRAALALPDDALPPADRRPTGPDPGPAVELMRAYVAARAAEAGIAPETLATTRDLERLARAHLRGDAPEVLDEGDEDDGERHDVLRGWRGALVGHDLLRLLEGKVSLRIDPARGSLRIDG